MVRVLESGKLTSFNLKPGRDTVIVLPLSRIQPTPGTEYFLNMSVTRDGVWSIVPQWNIYASQQFKLPYSMPAITRKTDPLLILHKKTVLGQIWKLQELILKLFLILLRVQWCRLNQVVRSF